jgi:hypothetical protein
MGWLQGNFGHRTVDKDSILLTSRLSKFCEKYLLGKLVSEIPPNPPLEKGDEGGILGITRNPEQNSSRKMT